MQSKNAPAAIHPTQNIVDFSNQWRLAEKEDKKEEEKKKQPPYQKRPQPFHYRGGL